MDNGIDLSMWNAVSDARSVRAAGIQFAWCKATEGTGWTDPTFARKVAQLRAAGIVVGAYHFLTNTPVAAQATHFRSVAGPAGCLGLDALAPMLDCEDPAAAGFANTAVRGFYDTLGAPKLDVYASLSWWQHTLLPGAWGQQRRIIGHVARYGVSPGDTGYGNPVVGVHQYTDTATVAGIPGAVDRDVTMPGWTTASLVLGGTVPSPPPGTPGPTLPAGDTWTVRAGDTLSAIASAWGTTIAAAATANGIPNPNMIYIGQVLHKPGTGAAAPAPTPTASGSTYVVRAGDTVSGIAESEHTTEAVLVTLNHLANPDRIYPGQHLTLPAPGAAGVGGGDRVYIVRPGDTLGAIAARLHYPGGWPALAAHNHLANPNVIAIGKSLRY